MWRSLRAPMNLGQRAAQIVEEIGPGPRQRRKPPDKDVVVTGFSVKGKDFTRRFLEPSPRTIADDRIADFPGDGEARARAIFVAALKRLQNETVRRPFMGAGGGQKFRPLLQSGNIAVPGHED